LKLPNGVLELAMSQAIKSPMTHKHGAVIFKGNTILGAGYNFYMGPPSPNHRQVSIHSEKDCLKGLRGDQIYGANVLAIRVHHNGSLLHGAPCTGCKKLMTRKGVKKAFWFDDQCNLTCTILN